MKKHFLISILLISMGLSGMDDETVVAAADASRPATKTVRFRDSIPGQRLAVEYPIPVNYYDDQGNIYATLAPADIGKMVNSEIEYDWGGDVHPIYPKRFSSDANNPEIVIYFHKNQYSLFNLASLRATLLEDIAKIRAVMEAHLNAQEEKASLRRAEDLSSIQRRASYPGFKEMFEKSWRSRLLSQKAYHAIMQDYERELAERSSVVAAAATGGEVD